MLLDAASIDHIPPHESGCKTPDTKDHSNGGQQAVAEHAFHFAVSSLWMCEQFPWLLPELRWLFKRLQLHRSCRKRTPCWWQWWNYTRTPHGGFLSILITSLPLLPFFDPWSYTSWDQPLGLMLSKPSRRRLRCKTSGRQAGLCCAGMRMLLLRAVRCWLAWFCRCLRWRNSRTYW